MNDDHTEAAGPTATSETATPHRRNTHRRAVWMTIVATHLVLVLATVGGVVFTLNSLNGNIEDGASVEHKVEEVLPDGVAQDAKKKPLNILVMGSDSRVGDGNGIDGENEDGSERSDTVILLHVSRDRTNAYGISLPRDAMIDRPDCMVDGETIPGESYVRFNTAFSVGGPVCTLQTVEQLTGIHVHHFVVLDFAGFKDMVDAVDGVEVCIPTEVDDDEHDIHFDAGTQVLDGDQALNYVRERYQLSVTGDIGRMKRQQAFIASMIKKVSSAGTLSQPTRVYGFLDAVTNSIKVDDGLDTVDKLYDLAMELRTTGPSSIRFITVPILPDPNNPDVTLVWSESADDLWELVKQDQKLGKDFTEGSIRANDDVGTTDEGDDEPTESPSDGETLSPEATERAEAQAQERRMAGLCV
ncbi:LCP family protein [Nocardioides sp. C4-1]|uniref:LCP family protein n=1 Tax=Nocardioides sp. C4-1 TaxID=3151851 RepID=UPI003263948F